MVVCLRGRLVEEFYDELERRRTDAIELTPNGPVMALNIPIGQWHTVRVLESGMVIMEVKDGGGVGRGRISAADLNVFYTEVRDYIAYLINCFESYIENRGYKK